MRELSVMYRGGPGGGWGSLVFAGRRRRVGSLTSLMTLARLAVSLVGRRRRVGSLTSLMTRTRLAVSLVGRRRRRVFSWARVRGAVRGGRARGLAGSIGRLGPGGGRSASPVALRTNKNTNVSETKQNKTKR